MSKVQLQGNVSGTGIFTIASPNSNTDRTLNLPDAAGTIQVSGNPISGTTGTFTGLLDISAAGAGQIQFPATQNASSNANTLDDYEEGTWSPQLIGLSSNPTVGYTQQAGFYTKIGNMVRFHLSLQWSSYSGGSGTLAVTLPFACLSTASWQGTFNCSYAGGITPALKGVGYTDPGRSDFFIRLDVNNTSICGVADAGSAGHLIFGGTFMTA